MAKPNEYTLEIEPQAFAHIRAFDRKHHGLIFDALERQLAFDAEVETTNRKRLYKPVLDATWELRLGPGNRFRAFYDINAESRTVRVIAVGEKYRERLWIAGEEYQP